MFVQCTVVMGAYDAVYCIQGVHKSFEILHSLFEILLKSQILAVLKYEILKNCCKAPSFLHILSYVQHFMYYALHPVHMTCQYGLD